ncbi:MAG: cation-transporting P-type ATPase, partial [Sandaracinaceae bacterium]|nr:cation-transporting P-type ATPase [Sandaracinaceae bacterium]
MKPTTGGSNGLQIHEVPIERVPEVLRSRASGLRASEVAERRTELGPNVLSRPPRFRWLRLLAAQLTNFVSLLLDAAAVLCFVADALSPDPSMRVLGVALFVVAVLNAGFSLAQHVRAERAMEKLRSLLPPRVRVRREGREERVLADELVPGDVVLVAEGDRVPADARLIEGVDLLVDNAPLTGESSPLARSPAPAPGRAMDSPNTLFAGATILRGSGVGIVFATGRRTELGRIASLSEQVRRPLTPLGREIRKMVRTLTAVAVGMGALFFVYGLAVGRPWLVNVVFALGILVANVPEGLLPTSTLALAVGGLRLARRRVLVRTLEAVESLGSVDVICTDKTGTLTLNRLSVTRVVGASGDELAERPLRALLETSLLACELRERAGVLHGDPLDVAVAAAYSRHADDALAIVASVSERFAFDVHKRRAGGVRREGEVYRYGVKGAWESLRSAVHTVDGEPASEASLSEVDQTVRRLASAGYRVIAVASRRVLLPAEPAPPSQEALEQELTLEGFLCIEDPLRPEVPAAVATCRRAGIRVIVVTGDHPDTARAIAERAGIVDAGAPAEQIVGGDALDRMREPELMAVLREGAAVFARTTPEQKMKIVLALKRLGHCVAMTGDGVNDAPALKAADVGVAMGQRGTDVARESAQIVLLDDNFASIVAGIEEGRTVFANLRKFTTYVLASNGPEMAPFLLYVVLPVPLALTIVQILWIDLGTDIV